MLRCHRRTAVTVLIALTIACCRLSGQEAGINARQAGMAYSGAALMTGVDALGVNPARIASGIGKTVSISLLPAGVDIGTDFVDLATYNRYFTGVDNANGEREPYYLNDADKKALLSKFHEGTGHFFANGNLTLAAVTFRTPVGAFGINVSDQFESSGTI